MGRPDQNPSPSPSPKMNNNFNPVFNAEPVPPVYEKQMVQAEQEYPIDNGGMVNQTNQVPIGRPGPPFNHGGMGYQPNQVPMGRPGPPFNNVGMGYQPNQVPIPRPVQPSNWSSGLFDCMNDPENTIITCCFPFVTFGQIAEIIDEGATSCGTGGMLYGLICCLFWIPSVYSCTYRAKMRTKFGLPDAPAPDWITHCFCEYCALCQEYRELNHRGLDPAIGWIGNVQKQRMGQQQEMMTPPMGQRMG